MNPVKFQYLVLRSLLVLLRKFDPDNASFLEEEVSNMKERYPSL